ncbi:MAG: MFS transporter [Bacteroidetes bacterium]|nr:MFS transporter [Bacteroidota bacterium]MCL5025906.1 MFS transporter [Chloroflexota bacterium]
MSIVLAGRAAWLPLFSNRSFMAIWLSRGLASIGEWVGAQVALMALVYYLTDSAWAVSVLQSIHAVPVLLLAPLVGVLLDRWDRKTTLMLAHLTRGALFFTLAFTNDLPRILLTYLGVNLAMLFFVPGTSAILPGIVGRQQLVAANSLTSTTSNIAMVFGASLGGAIILWAGIPVALAVDGICSVVAGLGIGLAVVPPIRDTAGASISRFAQELVAGARYMARNRLVAAVVAMNALMAMGTGAINTMAIVFASRTLGAGPAEYSMLLTASGLGALTGTLLVVGWSGRARPRQTFNLGFALLAVAVVSISLSRTVPVAAAAYFIAGLGQVGVNIMANVMVQQSSADRYLGRVFGFMQMVRHAASFLAVASAGWFSELVPVEMVLLVIGVVMVGSATLSFRLVHQRPAQSAVTRKASLE